MARPRKGVILFGGNVKRFFFFLIRFSKRKLNFILLISPGFIRGGWSL